jgi:hypothetical protein
VTTLVSAGVVAVADLAVIALLPRRIGHLRPAAPDQQRDAHLDRHE